MKEQADLEPREKWKSAWNSWMFKARQKIQFQRSGYFEEGGIYSGEAMSAQALRLLKSVENVYGFKKYVSVLAPEVYLKNLATLWILEQTLEPQYFSREPLRVLEPGCQDFSRLLGISTYLQLFQRIAQVEGIEIDPYPILNGFHSRADKAAYYISLSNAPAFYRQGNFFQCQDVVSLLLCFYPFVSPHPALAWGLPAHLGNAQLWVASIDRCLSPSARCLLVHQGDWEEEAFDQARASIPNSLQLVTRKSLDCPFYPQPYTAHASVYEKQPIKK